MHWPRYLLTLATPLLLAGSFVKGVPVLEAIEDRNAAPDNVTILGVTATGTGCPKGHADVLIDATRTIFDVAFDEYEVRVGPGAKDKHRKNCKVGVNLKFPPGYQFSIVDTTFHGYASLAKGQTGQCKATYSFAGYRDSVSWSEIIHGYYENDYRLYAPVAIESWSPCGQSAILNINSEIRITPISSQQVGYMNVDSLDGRVHVKYAVRWRKCNS